VRREGTGSMRMWNWLELALPPLDLALKNALEKIPTEKNSKSGCNQALCLEQHYSIFQRLELKGQAATRWLGCTSGSESKSRTSWVK